MTAEQAIANVCSTMHSGRLFGQK